MARGGGRAAACRAIPGKAVGRRPSINRGWVPGGGSGGFAGTVLGRLSLVTGGGGPGSYGGEWLPARLGREVLQGCWLVWRPCCAGEFDGLPTQHGGSSGRYRRGDGLAVGYGRSAVHSMTRRLPWSAAARLCPSS